MIYLISQELSTFGMLEFDRSNALERSDFWQGFRLDVNTTLRYKAKKKSDWPKLTKLHMIESATGPMLVSTEFKKIIERVAPDDAEFIPAIVGFGEEESNNFWALNLLFKVPCVDMAKSEFKQTNFDPNDPDYSFGYLVMKSDWESVVKIAICAEQQNQVAVRESVKTACLESRLAGLVFYASLDRTYGGRTVCIRSA